MKNEKEQWIVMVEEGVYLTNNSGRYVTLCIRYAYRFENISKATYALARSRKNKKFENAQIYKV